MKFTKNIYRRMRRLSGRKEEPHTTFKSHYYGFKRLLYANRRALEAMAEMEEALRGTRPFGMNAVRAWCTTVSANVHQIIKSLDELVPGKYETLYERFDAIRKHISTLVHPLTLSKGGPLALSLEDVHKDQADDVGPKMAFLGEMKRKIRLAAKVPNGFVVTTRGYERFIEHNDLQTEIYRRIQAASADRLDELYRLSSSIQLLISLSSKIPGDLEEAILQHYSLLEQKEGGEVTLAVRSSALGEDLRGISFAGQYRSELNVRPESILQAYKNVVASKYSLPAMTYRLNRGIRDDDVAMCVGCMAMVNAMVGGVAYSRNPVDMRDDTIIVNSVWGLPKSVVEGTTPSDRFIISRDEPLAIRQKDIAVKERKIIPLRQEGLFRMDITAEKSREPSLTDEQVLKIAQLVVDLEAFSGTPQDMEWALDADGSVVLLQCRPLRRTGATGRGAAALAFADKPDGVIVRGGVTASPGVAAGPVFFVSNDLDALQFPDQAVMVAHQSLPRWAALLSRAAAVVTEQGSSVGHLATVAREFAVPALFGVEGAMDQLQNGQVVTVDADACAIHHGRAEALLNTHEQPKSLMEGSPVMETLKATAQYVTPLYLIDPESPEFQPRNCRTLHDITRFCHEKILEEMFRLGNENRLIDRSSKKLKCDLPMTYWLLNLDDGFEEEVDDEYVALDNIASVPMLAFWKGMTAVPWEGPPSVKGGGLMSAFLQAAMNPNLEPALRSPYATRNYCLIAKHFCILQLRFNFHFCTMESLVGETAMNNYIVFHFKGGAANLERRMFRARMVAEVLKKYGFRTEFKEDASFARLEGHDQAYVEERLKILGYVTMHTRQLDMAMSDEATYNHYLKKILTGVEKVMAAA
jgi:pyruvate,water dikinase